MIVKQEKEIEKNPPIRVLQIVTQMNRNGLETILMNYYRNIDRNKVQFDFLTHRLEEKAYDKEIEALGGKVYHLMPLNPFNPKYINMIDTFFSSHSEYKIVHAHLDTMSSYVLKSAKKYGVPNRIAHSHNTAIDINHKYFLKIASKRSIPKYATEYFACGHEAGNWLFPNNKFQLMKNAIDTSIYRYDSVRREKVREKLGVENNYVIGHVGRFSKQKNHEFIIDIFGEVRAKLPNSTLLLIGAGELEEKTHKKVEIMNLEKSVVFLGTRKDIPELLQAMDLFLLPSLYEGFGVALIEAQTNGLPCVVSDSITYESILNANVKRISLNESSKYWADMIIKSLDNSKRVDNVEKIKAHGLDIIENAVWLENYYIGMVGEG